MSDANDADAWIGLARALLAIKPDQGSERYDLPVNASGAACIAYERAQTPAAKAARPGGAARGAEAPLLLAPGHRRAEDQPHPRRRRARCARPTTKLVAEHGFRMIDYKVEAEAALPRLCIQFSERLALGPGRLVASTSRSTARTRRPSRPKRARSASTASPTASATRCRCAPGLPSAVGEKLPKTAEIAVYVRDRKPSVRVTGRGYVLPNRGQQGIPLVTVNTDKVERRGLPHRRPQPGADAAERRLRQRRSPSYELDTLKERTGAQVYTGELARRTRSTRT